jgi:hypothetical protein
VEDDIKEFYDSKNQFTNYDIQNEFDEKDEHYRAGNPFKSIRISQRLVIGETTVCQYPFGFTVANIGNGIFYVSSSFVDVSTARYADDIARLIISAFRKSPETPISIPTEVAESSEIFKEFLLELQNTKVFI